MGDWISKHWSGNDFPECSTVRQGYVCNATGKIAKDGCGKGVQGWWKSTNAPYCDNRELGFRPAQTTENPGSSSNGGN